jgi:hypothetical protein
MGVVLTMTIGWRGIISLIMTSKVVPRCDRCLSSSSPITRDHEANIRRTVKTATTKMMAPKTQSTNEDIRATIQQMATDIQELKQNRQFNTHSSEDTHRNWRGPWSVCVLDQSYAPLCWPLEV